MKQNNFKDRDRYTGHEEDYCTEEEQTLDQDDFEPTLDQVERYEERGY